MRILIVYYRHKSTFIQRDIDILSKHFEIDELSVNMTKDVLNLSKKIRKSDVVFVWFAGKHAGISVFLARLFRKKSIVVVGGYDAAKVPEINYGLWAVGGFLDRYLAKYSLNRANKVLVVDPSLKEDLIKNVKIKGNNIEWVPTGYDYNFWTPKDEKENMIITVSGVIWNNVKRKGLETFVRAAKHFPDVKFVLVGKHIDNSINYLKSVAPSNVEFTGFISTEKLREYYRKAKVYCQLSRYEGLPNALCEAMLCECVPVGTKYCGIPRAIGDLGFYVPYGDAKKTAEKINEALNADSKLGKLSRERIIRLFPEKKRESMLINLLNNMIPRGERCD